jgi:hypothetical protein
MPNTEDSVDAMLLSPVIDPIGAHRKTLQTCVEIGAVPANAWIPGEKRTLARASTYKPLSGFDAFLLTSK